MFLVNVNANFYIGAVGLHVSATW